MLIRWLLAAHIVILGYWLGAELVINSTYRYIAYGDTLPFTERSRLMEHVMRTDQHVRYALILQASVGPALAALYGFIPGGTTTAWGFGLFGAVWLAFVEAVHRLRHHPVGKTLASIDRSSRYAFILILLAIAFDLIGGTWPMPHWLRWKLALFAGVILCGVGIRFALITHFRTWAIMAQKGPTEETNAAIKRTYVRATSVLCLLWAFIISIVIISVWQPA